MVLEGLDREVREYIQGIEEQKEKAEAETKLLKIQYRQLKEEYELLLLKRFSRSAEQLLKDKRQLFLFNEAAQTDRDEKGDDTEEKTQDIPSYTRKKAGRKPIGEHIPRRPHIIDIPESEKQCGCGAQMTRIGEEISEKLHIIPPQFYVEQIIRPKYACRICEGTEDEGKKTVRIAPVPPSIIPRGIATPGLLSTIMISKYQDHLPFYRQEVQFERIGATISRQDMSNWQQQVYQKIAPLFTRLKQEIKKGPIMSMDETTVQVMGEEGRADTTTSYMWLARGGPPGKPVLLFEYRETRAAKNIPEFLDGFSGYLQTDGYDGYDCAAASYPSVRHVGCFAHARRYFFEAAKVTQTKGVPKGGLAEEAIGCIGKLYGIEKELREEVRKGHMSLTRFLSERGKRTTPVLEYFKAWLDKRALEVPPSLRLGKAIAYTLGQWDKLTAYLECAYLTPDNNASENAIRPFVLGRKNWLFNKSPEGARSSCGMYSLIETAKQNGLNPAHYLLALFHCCPLVEDPHDWEDFLPWNIKSSKKITATLKNELNLTLN
jgi:transposase